MAISKANGVKEAPPAKKHVHGGAGDDEDGDDSNACSEDHERLYPENVFKRVQALKNLHMDVQKVKKEFDEKIFRMEAEYHKKLAPVLQKRGDIIAGRYEPSENESKFSLKEGAGEAETLPADGKNGIPKFWLEVLSHHSLTSELINYDVDAPVLEHLVDVRLVYTENPLGFKLEFEFEDNPFFTNKVLTRTYVFAEESPKEELYVNASMSPSTTTGTEIEWKEGKNITKKKTTSSQRNKKTGERRQIVKEEDVESFFKFFSPLVTDLTSLTKTANDPASHLEDDDAFQEKLNSAEYDFEVATALRSRVIPRALLIFTGEEDDDLEYSEDDYDGDESDEDGESDAESSSDADAEPPAKKGKSPKK